MSDFTKSKIGDQVYSITAGWGNIVNRIDCILVVDFGHEDTYEYTLDGKADQADLRPELYPELMVVIPQKVLSNGN